MARKQVFESLSELMAAVEDGTTLTAYLVKYRNKDHYILAECQDEALACVAREMKIEIGLVPLDLLVKAALAAIPKKKGEDTASQPAR